MGKSTVIQAILAMLQKSRNPFSGPYINIGKVSELKNRYAGSKEIEISVMGIGTKSGFGCSGWSGITKRAIKDKSR